MSRLFSLADIFGRLLEAYGPQHWWPADSSFEMMVGAVLTQNTAWSNVEKAMERLRANRLLDAAAILSFPEEKLCEVIRPSGYFRVKSARLRGLCRFLVDGGGNPSRFEKVPTPELREQLLSVKGIGPETADSILLYAFSRPVFVVDSYTVRLLDRLGRLPGKGTYSEVQDLFMRGLDPDSALFNEYHALVVIHGKERCRKKNPLCEGCPLHEICGKG
ncbi:MAG: endonuclease III domain-containing protein [Proteobacteria bacterium]|nr:endonuclease III domain-containing protein [Pseudomonadota bacterium]